MATKYERITYAQIQELVENWDSISSVKKWATERNLAHQSVQNVIKALREKDDRLCPKRATTADMVDAFYEKWKGE